MEYFGDVEQMGVQVQSFQINESWSIIDFIPLHPLNLRTVHFYIPGIFLSAPFSYFPPFTLPLLHSSSRFLLSYHYYPNLKSPKSTSSPPHSQYSPPSLHVTTNSPSQPRINYTNSYLHFPYPMLVRFQHLQ